MSSSAAFKIVTETSTYHTLKCVLAALIAKKPVDVSVLGRDAAQYPRRGVWSAWPILEDSKNPDGFLSDANVIAFKLASPAMLGDEATVRGVRQQLEWEAITFATLTSALYEKRQVVEEVTAAFAQLDAFAAKNKYFVGEKETLADVVMFAALLPAFCQDGLLPEESRASFKSLSQWYSAFEARHTDVLTKAYEMLGIASPKELITAKEVYKLTAPSSKPFYVTTPIYYVNASPHIGHVYSTLIADCLARYHRVKGESVFFMTGTDEHGQKIQKAASEQNLTPKEFTTRVADSFKNCFGQLDFSYDHFIRTSDVEHEANVQDMWRALEKVGDIYMGKYEGWYCVSDESFVTELQTKDIVDPKTGQTVKVSLESGHPVSHVVEDNYMFRLSAYQDRLLAWLRSGPVIVPEFRRQEVINLVLKGLPDLSVSRKQATINWAIPVPSAPEHVVYVWLDALTNYLTSAKIVLNADGTRSLTSAEALQRWPADVHVIGKDILKFHAIYWPAFLIGAGLQPPQRIMCHGWWTKDGMKISKSLGNAFDPVEKCQQFGLDAVKYFLLREASVKDDGDYSDKTMVARLNGELADTYGNLVLRCVSRKINAAGVVPTPTNITPAETALATLVTELVATVDHFMLIPDIQEALKQIFEVLRGINHYVTETEPWKLAKADPVRCATVNYYMLEAVRICTVLLSAAMPRAAGMVLDQFGVTDPALRSGMKALEWGGLKPGTPLGEVGAPIFPKHELPAPAAETTAAKQPAAKGAAKKEQKK
eukprot:PhM_4_TR613/c0_g1_i1/m.82811/K01874/MARS, metG; methionyl-tRNA synthetase